MKTRLLAASLLFAPSFAIFADDVVPPPLLELSSGLPGQQVRLSWPAEAGLRYRIEKSSSLGGGGGGAGGWLRVALIEATGPEAVWLDPEATTTKEFYRVVHPVAEVFSISPPLLSPTGGDLLIQGQCIPDGSVLILMVDGVPLEVVLQNLGGGVWRARVLGAFVPGASILATAINSSTAVGIVTLNQPITVTFNGLAADSAPALPPAVPMPVESSNPIPGVGIVVKRNPGSSNARFAPGADPDTSGWDTSSHSAAILAAFLSKKGYDYYQASSSMSSKKGYDYYQAQSALQSTGAQTNPYFSGNQNQGNMPDSLSSPLYNAGGMQGTNPLYEAPGSMAMGPSATCPSPSGLPGEVSFQSCDLALPCPAGPPLAWISTYRSMVPVSSGHGPGWDFSYNISIEPIPSTAGSKAPRLIVHDGGGRSDVFHRQSDGTYRCDGMFREGRFTGDTFTLTFADTGTWTFCPLDGSPAAGKIDAITDRTGVALDCDYDSSGLLSSVSDEFGRSLAVEWDSVAPRRIVSVTAASLSLNFTKITYTYSNQEKERTAASSPFVPGQAPAAGPTTYSYTSGFADPRLNGNLTSITDGAGRLLEAFTYTSTAGPSDIDYDTCISHDVNRSPTTGDLEIIIKRVAMPPGASPAGGYTMFEVDEVGRLTETDCDRLHRVVRVREYTGFCTPGVPVTSTTNRPVAATKVRDTDPDFFETSCAYNADSLCTLITHADGSQERVSYERDLTPTCPVRVRGNPRVMIVAEPGGKATRTVSCEYEPGFGNPESECPGNPIGGLTIKGGKNPGGGMGTQGRAARTGRNPQTGKEIKIAAKSGPAGGIAGGVVAGIVVAARNGGGVTWDDDWETPVAKSGINGINPNGMPNRISMNVTVPKQTQGATFGEKLAGGGDDDCDGSADFFNDSGVQGPTSGRHKTWLCCNFRLRMVSAHGQVSTWGYDADGNCTSALSSLPLHGKLYQYNGSGQCTSSTVLNGPGSSFQDEFNYDPVTGFLSSVVCDSTGLHLTTSCDRDPQGRVIRVVDPRLNDWLFAYNPLDQCLQVQSPGMPNRISMNVTIDAGGRAAVCSCTHLRSDGSPDPANPEYSTFYVHDSRARLRRVADEELVVDASGSTDPDTLGIENFAVCDIGYDPAGQVVSLSTPAACRMQDTDEDCDFTYDERGLLHRCIEGGLGSPSSVTTECDYDAAGAVVRCATVAAGVQSPETLYAYDGFHRLASVTDPMGNITTYAYDNQGFVTWSVFGEVNDVPGSSGNTLLAKGTGHKGDYLPAHNFKLEIDFARSNPLFDIRTKYGYDSLLGARGANPFFGVEVEDDTFTVERFAPGSAAQPVTEVTVIDRSPAGLVQSVTCNGDTLLTCTYDSAGRLATCSNGACTTALTRDGNGNVLVCGTTDHFRVPGMPDKTFTVTRVYDALGRCVQATDGSGNRTLFAWDSLSRCVSVTEPGGLVVRTTYDGSSATGPFSGEVSADTDGDGDFEVLRRWLSRSGSMLLFEDSHGHRTSFTRDSLDRVTRCDFPDGTHEATTFDPLGRASSHTRKNGAVIACDYDYRGQVTSISHDPLSLPEEIVPVPATTFAYNGLGDCVSCEQGSSLLEFSYDSLGNPLSESHNGRLTLRDYNYRGRTTVTYPDGRRFAESRDALGQLISISALDSNGLPVSPPVVTMEYAGQRVWRSTQANGVVSTFNYRGDGQAAPPADHSFDACVEMSVTNALAHELTHVVQQRNGNQRVITCNTTYSSAPQGPPGRSKAYTYDRLGYLTGCLTRRRELAGGPVIVESEVSYVIGKEGQRISELRSGTPGLYTQDNGIPPGDQQMGQYTTWSGGQVDWDDEGNLRSIHRGTIAQTYTHDAEGRLLSVSDPATGSTLVTYGYDAVGRRVTCTLPAGAGLPPVVTEFVYDGSECIQEFNDSGTGVPDAAVTFVSSGGVKHCISTRNGTLYYPAGAAAMGRGADRHCTCTPGYSTSSARNKVEHWGDPHENLNGRCALMTTAGGEASERFDFDDAGKPVFLASDGTPTSANSAIGPIRWLAPEAMWEPSIGMLLGTGCVYSPELGMTISRGNGHVTVLKAAATGGGGGSGGSKAQDHNSSRSNKTSS